MHENVCRYIRYDLVRFDACWYVLVCFCTFCTFWCVLVRFNTSGCRFGFFDMKLSLERIISHLSLSLLFSCPSPPHAHVRLSLGREPASTELGSGERDAYPPIRVCFCLGALLRCGIAWYLYIKFSFLSSAVTRRRRLRCVLFVPSPT
jgi:hypothetical protein